MIEFIERHFTNASEFLSALRLSDDSWKTTDITSDYFNSRWSRQWIFRGQACSQWPLLPKAWRFSEENCPKSNNQKQTINNPVYLKVQTLFQQRWFRVQLQQAVGERNALEKITPNERLEDESKARHGRIMFTIAVAFAEMSLIREFITLADELGFSVSPLPEWTQEKEFIRTFAIRRFPELNNPSTVSESDLEKLWLHPAVALAQHHGLPTRLLDWTRNPINAAFFAAADLAQKDSHVEGKHIAVYALHRDMFRYHIRLVEIASSSNDFLRAQQGILTVDLKAEDFYLDYEKYVSVEESVRQIEAKRVFPQPRKYTLPAEQAPELLRLLWLERVTHAHLMPTLDHVAEAVLAKNRLSQLKLPQTIDEETK